MAVVLIDGCARAQSAKYLALGDSYTIGESVDPAQRWPVQLAAMLARRGLDLGAPQIIARTGWTTGELMAAIDAENPKGPYQLVSLLIGVNNQFRGLPPDQFRAEFSALLDRAIVLAGNDARHVVVLSIPDYGVTPFGRRMDGKKIARELEQFNAASAEICKQKEVAFVDITPISRRAASEPTLVADDGLHPSGEMYRLWSEAALDSAERAARAPTTQP